MTEYQLEIVKLTRPVWWRLAFTVAAIIATCLCLMVLHAREHAMKSEVQNAVVDR